MKKLEHLYGDNVHINASPLYSGILARLCSPKTVQPEINRLVEACYRELLSNVLEQEFPKEKFTKPTRMTEMHPDSPLKGKRLQPDQKTIVVNLARAGTYPSHVCFDFLHFCLNPQVIRQDHIFASRAVDPKNQHVIGTDLSASKIGGDKDKAIVLIPDPMAATGATICATLDHYKGKIPGAEVAFIALHLIVTPEYLARLKKHHPDVKIYALRLDRGLSPQAILETTPGQHWDKEKGLNSKDYIVPGGGGFGEIMNNSFV